MTQVGWTLYGERASPRYIEAREPRWPSSAKSSVTYQRGARSHLAPLRHPGPRNAQTGPPVSAHRNEHPRPGVPVAASGEWAP